LRWETPLEGLAVGTSALVQALDGSGPEGSLHVAPFLLTDHYAEFRRGKFYAAAEYRRVPAGAVLSFGPVKLPDPADYREWFVMGSYRLTRQLHTGTYYSHYINKALDFSQPTNYSKDWAISGRYDFNAFFYGKIEGHFLRGTGLGYYASTNPTGLKPNSNILAAKIGFSF
jgi:hypothetical protein